MDTCTLGLPCALLLSALLLVTVSGAQKCVPEVIPDTVIDISQAVARGARFTDPLSVTSVQECLSACCMKVDVEGVNDCNFLVFDARKSPGLQNCYIFHCPMPDSCPLLPSPGVFSYSLWSETSHPEKRDPEKVQQKTKSSGHSNVQSSPGKKSESAVHPSASVESGPLDPIRKKNITLIASQEPAIHYAKEEPVSSSKSITTQLLHLVDTIDQHMEKMESKSAASKDNPQVHYPTPTAAIVSSIWTTTIPIHGEVKNLLPDAKKAKPGNGTYKKPEDFKVLPTVAAKPVDTVSEKTSPRLSTAGPLPVPRTKASLTVPPAASKDVSGAKKMPSSNVKSTKLPESDHAANNGTPMATPKKVSHPLPHTEVPALTTVHQTRPSQMVTHPAPLRTSPWKGIKPSTKTNDQPPASDEVKTPGQAQPETHPPAQQKHVVNLEETPRKADGTGPESTLPSLEDKSGLVAALVFGMLFLMVVIGLITRKVSEARRRHQYTKLDYLINGMYVDT